MQKKLENLEKRTNQEKAVKVKLVKNGKKFKIM